jgi:hypothetical protein
MTTPKETPPISADLLRALEKHRFHVACVAKLYIDEVRGACLGRVGASARLRELAGAVDQLRAIERVIELHEEASGR